MRCFAFRLQQRIQIEFGAIELRQDFLGEARDQRILAPLGTPAQRCERGTRFDAFADAFERLVLLVFEQASKPAASDGSSSRLRPKIAASAASA